MNPSFNLPKIDHKGNLIPPPAVHHENMVVGTDIDQLVEEEIKRKSLTNGNIWLLLWFRIFANSE
jgi:hypothetical protein